MVISRRVWFLLLGVLALVLPAGDIQAATPGSKVQIPATTSPKRWPDVGYDAQNNVYLAVIGSGPIQGRFVSADGALLSSALGSGTFNISTTAGFHQSPRVSCGAGVCAVFWAQEGSPTVPTVRVISYTAGFVSAPTPIASTPGVLTEVGHGITFASGDNEFVAAWAYNGSVKFSRISLAGQLLQSTVIPAATGWKSGAYAAYNPVLDEVVVSFAGTKTVGGVPDVAFVSVQRVQNGALLGGVIDLATGGSTYLPMGEFNPTTNNITVTYYKSAKFYAREVGAGGALGPVTLISSLAAYDALDVAYNANANRFLLVTHGPSVEDVAVEFTPALVPSPYFTLTSNGGNGNFNPRVVSHGTDAKWLAVTSNNFSALWAQFAVGSTCTGNCGGGPPPPPPAPPPLSVTSLVANKTFPIELGTSVTFTATATGGTAPYTYRFVTYNSSTGWAVTQDYSSFNTFTYFPAAGTNAVQVWVRNAGSVADYDAWLGTGYFTVTSPTVAITAFTVSRGSPITPGSTTVWTATAQGPSALEYQFWLWDGNTGIWSVVQDYSSLNSLTWTPGAAHIGPHYVQVWVRTVGSSANYQDWEASPYFIVSTMTGATLTTNPNGTTRVGQAMVFTGTGQGGSGNYEYRFWRYTEGPGWTLAQDFGPYNTFTWYPTAGVHAVQVWVRQTGSTAVLEAYQSSGLFTVVP